MIFLGSKDHVVVPMALGVRPWRVSMASLYVVCMTYVVYVAFIANMDYVIMWIVWGMLWGTH